MTTKMQNNMKSNSSLLILLYCYIVLLAVATTAMNLFDIKIVESNDSRLVATGNSNYALSSPKLSSKGWRTVSINGDTATIVTTSGQKIVKSIAELGQSDRSLLENLRDEIAESKFGFSHTSISGSMGGSSSMMTTTSGDSFSSSSSSGFSSSSETSGNGMSVAMKDDNNFSVAKSNLPFNWLRVFVNGDLVTVVLRDGRVQMSPMNAMPSEEVQAVNNLKIEMKEFQKTSTQQAAHTMQQSMDMVNNIFGNIMGSLPKPPSYSSAVGNTFGNNFPFGPNNSPFSASSGWPFGGGSFAFAGGRRR